MRDATIIIVVLIIGLIILAPTLMTGFGGLLDWISDFVKYGFDGASTGDAMSIAFQIRYKDGTQADFESPMTGLDILPLEVTLPSDTKAIDEIHIYVRAVIEYNGEPSGYVYFNGQLEVFLDDVSKTSKTFADQQTPQLSGSRYNIAGNPVLILSDETIEKWAGSYGQHTIKSIADLTVKMSFADGHSEEKQGTGEGSLTIHYQADPLAITGLTVTVGTAPVRRVNRPY